MASSKILHAGDAKVSKKTLEKAIQVHVQICTQSSQARSCGFGYNLETDGL